MVNPKLFPDSMPGNDHAKLKVHAAWCNHADHETVSVVIVKTTKFPPGAWMLTRVYLLMSIWAESAWNVIARIWYMCAAQLVPFDDELQGGF